MMVLAALVVAACHPSPVEQAPDASEPALDAPAQPSGSPWDSRASCQALVAAGQRAPRDSAAEAVRISTWNVRWFPLGYAPFDAADGEPTDIAWLACAIVWLQADVVVLEEVLGPSYSATALAQLRDELEQLDQTGPWSYALEACPDSDMQHVALVFRHGDDVDLLESESFKLSGSAQPLCSLSQRPAFVAHYDYRGMPLAIAGVHLKSGRGGDDYQMRRDSMLRLGYAILAEDRDKPFVVAGDFNSMGCGTCDPQATGADEVSVLADELAFAGLTHAPPSATCSQYTGERPRLLDHLAVRGAGAGGTARVDGPCAELACVPLTGEPPPAFVHLSDHCPVSIDLPLVR